MAKAPPPKPSPSTPVRPAPPPSQYLAKFNDGARNQPTERPAPPTPKK